MRAAMLSRVLVNGWSRTCQFLPRVPGVAMAMLFHCVVLAGVSRLRATLAGHTVYTGRVSRPTLGCALYFAGQLASCRRAALHCPYPCAKLRMLCYCRPPGRHCAAVLVTCSDTARQHAHTSGLWW